MAPSREEVPTSSSHREIVKRLDELGILDDPEFVAGAFATFLESGDASIAHLSEAIASGDTAGCEQYSHRLKGASLNLGAERLGEITRRLEVLGRRGELAGAGPLLEELRHEFAGVRAFMLHYPGEKKAA